MLETIIQFKVYELNKVMSSSQHMALGEVKFKDWGNNSFDSEEDAIKALVDENMTYIDFIILKTVFIRNV